MPQEMKLFGVSVVVVLAWWFVTGLLVEDGSVRQAPHVLVSVVDGRLCLGRRPSRLHDCDRPAPSTDAGRRQHMKHAHVDETLTRAEREAPFQLSPPDPALDDGPIRLACVWDGEEFVEVDVLGAIKAARIAAARDLGTGEVDVMQTATAARIERDIASMGFDVEVLLVWRRSGQIQDEARGFKRWERSRSRRLGDRGVEYVQLYAYDGGTGSRSRSRNGRRISCKTDRQSPRRRSRAPRLKGRRRRSRTRTARSGGALFAHSRSTRRSATARQDGSRSVHGGQRRGQVRATIRPKP
jgi:hypothetical protein